MLHCLFMPILTKRTASKQASSCNYLTKIINNFVNYLQICLILSQYFTIIEYKYLKIGFCKRKTRKNTQ